MSGAYRNVLRIQADLSQAALDNTRAAHTRYLQSVEKFLECAAAALGSSISSTDQENLHAYVRDVLIEVTGDLLDVFAQNRAQTTVEPIHLFHVVRHFRSLDDSTIENCIPDDFVSDVLRLMDLLCTYADYDSDSRWVNTIKWCAREFKDTIIRVKSDPNGR